MPKKYEISDTMLQVIHDRLCDETLKATLEREYPKVFKPAVKPKNGLVLIDSRKELYLMRVYDVDAVYLYPFSGRKDRLRWVELSDSYQHHFTVFSGAVLVENGRVSHT